jgi:Domain of unknown function DUF29
MPDGPRYDDDFYAWAQYQAEVLRTMPAPDNRFDREHVAEEIEDLAKSERDAVRSQIRRIIEHLLKLEYSPADDPRFDWMASIGEARQALADKITRTLQRDVETMLPQLYADGRELADIGLRKYRENAPAAARLPSICPYTLEQIRQRGWYPEPTKPD